MACDDDDDGYGDYDYEVKLVMPDGRELEATIDADSEDHAKSVAETQYGGKVIHLRKIH